MLGPGPSLFQIAILPEPEGGSLVRGLFASFGHNEGYKRGEWISAARYDAYDITEWLAEQPWSNGKIGMWGCSATEGSQMQAVTTAPPHLKAIFPMNFAGLPYHRFFESDVAPLVPGEPTVLSFSILPISMIFKAGHKIQLATSFAGRETTRTEPAPDVTIHRDSDHPSWVILPTIPARDTSDDGGDGCRRPRAGRHAG